MTISTISFNNNNNSRTTTISMDLATVKARVKAWEKSFRATHSREPTKDDIKQDASDIADLYALYRRLSKAQSQGKSQSRSSSARAPSSSASASTTLAPASTNTPPLAGTTRPPGAGPPTPTPSARSRARASLPAGGPFSSTLTTHGSPEAGPSRAGPSTSTAPITPQKRQPLFSTPKKSKPQNGHSGPVADPLPNPFSVTPRKNKIGTATFESPFLHAPSPRKLKEVIASASATRSSSRVEITPRTKARKRLAGEELEFTPVKAPRRRRGDRPNTAAATAAPIPDAFPTTMSDSDEAFGETPIKPGGATFGLVDVAPKPPAAKNGNTSTAARGKGPMDLFPIFQRAKRSADEAQTQGENARNTKRRVAAVPASDDEDEHGDDAIGSPTPLSAVTDDTSNSVRSRSIPSRSASVVSASASTASVAPSEDERLPTPPPGSPPVATASQRTPRQARAHVITLSDDEWDPEADTRVVRVIGTRRAAVRLEPDAGLASDDEMEPDGEDERNNADLDDDDDDDNAPVTYGDGEGSPATLATPMLSFLSLRSPIARVGERLADLRVRALLDPTSAAAAALRAAQRGQDVFVCGEVDGEGDEEWDMQVEAQVEGDDDWESDPEGWKATPGEDRW